MKRTQEHKTIGYIRVSTVEQDTEKNRAQVASFANQRDLGRVEFVEEKVSGLKSWKNRKLADVVLTLSEGDTLIVPELSRLGRSIADVLDVLQKLTDRGVEVFSVKENFQCNGDDITAKVQRTMLALFADIDSQLRSLRTKEGIAAVRARGVKLGRPKGPGKSRLDPHRDEIIRLIEQGSTRKYISEKFQVTGATVWNWLKKNKLLNLKPQP